MTTRLLLASRAHPPLTRCPAGRRLLRPRHTLSFSPYFVLSISLVSSFVPPLHRRRVRSVSAARGKSPAKKPPTTQRREEVAASAAVAEKEINDGVNLLFSPFSVSSLLVLLFLFQSAASALCQGLKSKQYQAQHSYAGLRARG